MIFFISFIILTIGQITSSIKYAVVNTTLGSIRGQIRTTKNGIDYYSFVGIPYAQAPTGNKRFKPPIPVKPWEGILNATQRGPMTLSRCYQSEVNEPTEDCLDLNIHTRRINDANNPVLVYIDGVHYAYFSSRNIIAPDYVVDQDIVLVTISYRLGLLGFFSTGDNHAPGNYGLKDQVEALKWVKNHIHHFGGDPSKITLVGQGASGAYVGLHLVSPMSRGLFHKVIILSGSPISKWAILHNPLEMARKQAHFYYCPSDNPKKMVDCMSTLSADRIRNLINLYVLEFMNGYNYLDNWYKVDLINAPVIETVNNDSEQFLIKQPIDSILQGDFAKVPIIIGTTKDEIGLQARYIAEKSEWLADLSEYWSVVAPTLFWYKRNDHMSKKIRKYYFGQAHQPILQQSADKLSDLLSDSTIVFDVLSFAKLMAEINTQPVYLYQLNYQAKVQEGVRNNTVLHGDDLLYIFYPFMFFSLNNSACVDGPFVNKYVTLWKNFLETGNPTPEASVELDHVIWKPYTRALPAYLNINKTLRIEHGIYNKERLSFWESIKPISSGKNRTVVS